MKKHNKWFWKFFFILVLILIVFGGYINYTIYTPVDGDSEGNISLIIKSGDSVRDIGSKLKELELIRDGLSFYGYVRLTGVDKDIVAGRYNLSKTMNVPEIIENITTISESETVITIQEGLTVSDIDEKLVDNELIVADDFKQAVKDFDGYWKYPFIDKDKAITLEFPLEGYLYPDTYFIESIEFESDQLINKMLDNFNNKFKEVDALFDAQDRTMHGIITMASILQREVRTEADFETVAGILWKRLDSNWHLGADATILYATKKKTIDASDLDFDSPYNTRLYVGMPPGPISNPDIEHIKAAISPKESDYWYYLTTLDTGEVIYAKTNDEQNINKAKYLY